ncbi:MAG: hypothetical protein M1825_004941 [Sarcosagium campestre]|nr:MAG: hypothetical protein M1825_004941 [Sarcosagium campestre]
MSAWASKGVYGHFTSHDDSPLSPFLTADEAAAASLATVLGALPSEVAVTGTLTSNLHILMASFYRPTKERWKIIIESKAFPSDHLMNGRRNKYAVESQIQHHSLNPADALVTVDPLDPSDPLISTDRILSTITAHVATTALVLLPGIQYYTGQFLDIGVITAHAHSHGILVGWDLAHAAGNVPLQLHDCDVDFAVCCTYKYLNAGPGAIGALFVHERHGRVESPSNTTSENAGQGEAPAFRPRLSGWWGNDKASRFQMDPTFHPIPGAAGYQLSNPSTLDLASLQASLQIFDRATLPALRAKSLLLTGYLEHLLLLTISNPLDAPRDAPRNAPGSKKPSFSIITPSDPAQRGAQLSLRLEPGLLDSVMRGLEAAGVVVDERRPDVVRVAPAPLYNSFQDVWMFVKVWGRCVDEALRVRDHGDV